MTRRRLSAIAALIFGVGTFVYAAHIAVRAFPNELTIVACLIISLFAATEGALRHGGVTQLIAIAVAVLAATAAVLLVIITGPIYEDALILAGAGLCLAAARSAFRVRVRLPAAEPPSHPILFCNPHSGDGKSERFGLPGAARARGIETVVLSRGDDLRELVLAAIERGANGLAMAGGDGSQAIVAELAAEHDLPYACIPAGTRNHFALDLGVDRADVVGALDAFVEGGERRVDLAEVNGRVFVNNVSLGVYAEAVQSEDYRGAKIRTLVETAPARLGPGAPAGDLRWDGYGGHGRSQTIALLVSNNRYRLGKALGSGTRPRLDAGVLGISVLTTEPRPWITRWLGPHLRQWARKEFTVEGDTAVPAGIDGEAAKLASPLVFRTRDLALRVRIASSHPGASPSAGSPDGVLEGIRRLAGIAIGR